MEEHKIVMRNSFRPYPLSHLDGFEPLAKLEKNRKPGKGLEREQFVIHILFSGIRSGMLSSNDSPEKKGAPHQDRTKQADDSKRFKMKPHGLSPWYLHENTLLRPWAPKHFGAQARRLRRVIHQLRNPPKQRA